MYRISQFHFLAAAAHGDPALVRLLIDAGADPRRAAADGRTPAARARGPFVREIYEMLPPETVPAPSPPVPEAPAEAKAPDTRAPAVERRGGARKKAR